MADVGRAVAHHPAAQDPLDLLLAVERLLSAHQDELDRSNVFPVPDADTGRNAVATVRAARVAVEQARREDRVTAAVTGALRGARGNAGSLVSQLLRGLFEEVPDDGWAERLARADELTRAAVAHPVEGSLLTAVRAAAQGAADAVGPEGQLVRAVTAAHRAVEESPGLLEVLARAGVVDAGARAAALVLEAIAAAVLGRDPAPPPIVVPDELPDANCDAVGGQHEVMYLVEPHTASPAEVVGPLRDELQRLGDSVVVVAADRLVSVHVHTDEVGAVLDAALGHGGPLHVRVEDLRAQTEAASSRESGTARSALPAVAGLVVGADGAGIASLAAEVGAVTFAVGPDSGQHDRVMEAIARADGETVLLLPGAERVLPVGEEPDGVTVVSAVDDPARLLSALAVLDPRDPDADHLRRVAERVHVGRVEHHAGRWRVRVDGEDLGHRDTVLAALQAVVAVLDDVAEEPEIVQLLLGGEAGVALADAAAGAIGRAWTDVEVDVVDAGLQTAVLVVAVE